MILKKMLTAHLPNLRTADGGTCTELLHGSNKVLWGSGYARMDLLSASHWSDEAETLHSCYFF